MVPGCTGCFGLEHSLMSCFLREQRVPPALLRKLRVSLCRMLAREDGGWGKGVVPLHVGPVSAGGVSH